MRPWRSSGLTIGRASAFCVDESTSGRPKQIRVMPCSEESLEDEEEERELTSAARRGRSALALRYRYDEDRSDDGRPWVAGARTRCRHVSVVSDGRFVEEGGVIS